MEERALHLRCRLSAPPEDIFAAWTDPIVMRRWLFASDSGDLLHVESDPRVGGRFSILERRRDSGLAVDHFGEYLEVDRPRRLVFTLRVPQHFPELTTIAIDITPLAGGYELAFTQTGIAPDKTEPFWRAMIQQLSALLDSPEP